ncbi:CAP-Gly domain-containing linker protein 1 isoform X3 [Polyergus mexicanus]|uniref:CAP-Gly domain-containing linker protein 1 isoform X3 n=1 Tax=Polyergus mexicanus TaxID=615972 RepID=UPI0038B497EB
MHVEKCSAVITQSMSKSESSEAKPSEVEPLEMEPSEAKLSEVELSAAELPEVKLSETKSSEPKPSGIRPPSKIERLCSSRPRRPDIPPPSPVKSVTTKINTSVVLTEDTESFMIGDRVWVGGTKPGRIAYIGETKFAPGDWAGVVLDEPIGKNDGSVAGSQYFQCEPKKGIFSRLTRLTRAPLGGYQMSATSTPTSPPESIRGSYLGKSMSPSLNVSTTSLSSSMSQRDELKIGDRVIVSSMQGSKTGILRYQGPTDFAGGEWYGVELDEPLGKNDGSVNGKRYFECPPKHGLFTVPHKVSRSPSVRKSSMVYKSSGGGNGTAVNIPSLQKRSGSRDSLASSIISVNAKTSTPIGTTRTLQRPGMRMSTLVSRDSLQEILKEKQHEIELLRKQRDLERERVTKAANQADQAEQSALSIKQEYDKYREQMQQTVNEAEVTVTKLVNERNGLMVQLEEEKRKCEDLLFRFEEESVNKDDIQKERSEQSVINTVNESRIKQLEEELAEERRERAAQLERDSIKLFEAEEELTRLRNEISCTTNSHNSQLHDLESRNQSLEEIKNSLEKEAREKSILVNECVERIRELELEVSKTKQENTSHSKSENRLERELEATRRSLQNRETLIENMKLEFEKSTNLLSEELRKSKETIETIKKESTSEKDSLLSEYRQTIEERDRLIKVKTEELENESRRLLEQQNVALEGLKTENIKRIHELSESFEQQLRAKDSKIEEISQQLSQSVSETERLLAELAAERELRKKKDEELIDALRKLEELNTKLKLVEENNNVLSKQIQDYRSKNDDNVRIIHEKQQLEQNLASLIASEEKSIAQLNKLNEELKVKDRELAELRNASTAQLEEVTKRFEAQINEKAKYIDEISADIAQKALMLAKLEKDIADLKAIIASKDEEIKYLLEKTLELQDALTLSEQTKTNLESELRVFESNVQNLNQQIVRFKEKISQLSLQKEKLECYAAVALSNSTDSSEQLLKYNEDLRKKEKELDEAREKIFHIESMLRQTEEKLFNTESESNKNIALVEQLRSEKSNLKSQLDDTEKSNTEYAEKIREYEQKQNELSAKLKESEHIKKNLEEKSSEIANLTERLTKKEEEIINLRGEHKTLRSSHEEQIILFQKQIADLSTQLTTSCLEMKNLQKFKNKLEADQSANLWSMEELTEKLKIESDKSLKLENLIQEKNLKLQDTGNKLSELQKTHDALVNDKAAADKNLTTSLNTMTNAIEELNGKLKDAEKIIKDKTDEVSKARVEIERSQAQIIEMDATISSMKNEHIYRNDELKNAQEVAAQKQNVVNELTKAKIALENSAKSMEIQLSNLHEELDKREKFLADMEITIKETSKKEEALKLRNSLECEIVTKQKEIEDINRQNKELEEKLRSLQDAVDRHKSDLNDKETIIGKLKAQMKTLEDAQVERIKAEQQSRNEETKSKQNELSGANKRIHELQHAMNALEKQLKEQADLARTMENNEKEVKKNIQNLQEKLNVAKTEETRLLSELSRLEKENKQVTAKWTEAMNQLKLSHENLKNTFDGTGDMKQQHVVAKLQEENDTTKSQIDFLNSVIVDMQRKNESLLCKIEVLEMGVPANEADDYTRSTLDKRTATPRMFCDICDRFDLHETEDCPRQAQDFSDRVPEKVAKSSKKQSVQRPYCENCEMFGHDTHNCDDAETF